MKRIALFLVPLVVGAAGLALRMGVVGGLPPTCC